MSESQVSKDSRTQESRTKESRTKESRTQESRTQESRTKELEEKKRSQESEEKKRSQESEEKKREQEESGAFRSKCAKCMDPCVKIALITFPIFLIASILIGILGLSSQGSKNNNSTDPSLSSSSSSSLPSSSSSLPSSSLRNVTRFKVPASTSTIFRSDIIHTSPADGDEDTHFYSILFLVLALSSLIVIFCGKYWTIGLYNPPPDTVDFDSSRSIAQSQPMAGNRVLLEEQITTV